MAWLTPPIWQPIALSDSTDGDHDSSPHRGQQFGLCGSDFSCKSPPTTGSVGTPPPDPSSSPASLDAGRLLSVALRVISLTSDLHTATAWPLSDLGQQAAPSAAAPHTGTTVLAMAPMPAVCVMGWLAHGGSP